MKKKTHQLLISDEKKNDLKLFLCDISLSEDIFWYYLCKLIQLAPNLADIMRRRYAQNLFSLSSVSQ